MTNHFARYVNDEAEVSARDRRELDEEEHAAQADTGSDLDDFIVNTPNSSRPSIDQQRGRAGRIVDTDSDEDSGAGEGEDARKSDGGRELERSPMHSPTRNPTPKKHVTHGLEQCIYTFATSLVAAIDQRIEDHLAERSINSGPVSSVRSGSTGIANSPVVTTDAPKGPKKAKKKRAKKTLDVSRTLKVMYDRLSKMEADEFANLEGTWLCSYPCKPKDPPNTFQSILETIPWADVRVPKAVDDLRAPVHVVALVAHDKGHTPAGITSMKTDESRAFTASIPEGATRMYVGETLRVIKNPPDIQPSVHEGSKFKLVHADRRHLPTGPAPSEP